MNIRKSFLILVCVLMAAATPALHALTVRNGTTLTVEAVLDDVLAPAIVSKTLLANEQWNTPTSPEARYALTFRQGGRELASTVLHGGARVAELEAMPDGFRIIVAGEGGKAATERADATGCMSGEMIGLVFGCLTFNSHDGESFTIGGNTKDVPVLGPTCICGTKIGKSAPCIEPGFFVESVCPIVPASAAAEPEPQLIVRNLTPTPTRVNISNPPAMVIFSRDIPPQGSITLPGGKRLTSLAFSVNGQPVASTLIRDVAVAALEKLPTRYVVAIVPNETAASNAASTAGTSARTTTGCWSGAAIGLVMDSRAFSSGNESFYLAGNLSDVPFLGATCVCGTLLPPNEKAPIPLPIIAVSNLCGD